MLAMDVCVRLALNFCDLNCISCRDGLHTQAHALHSFCGNENRAKG